jgi:hypothetical protein
MEYTESDEMMIPFLRNLADSIDNKSLSARQLHSIGEFYMSYQFQKEAAQSGDTEAPTIDFSKKDMLKFLVLGWWVYSHLQKGETLPPSFDIDGVD